jgi:hypothetical protein
MNNNFTVESHQERRQRRAVIASALDIIPDDMDFNDGCIMLNILYPIWKQTRLEYEEIFEEPCNLQKVWKEFVPWYGTDLEGRITILVLGDPDLADDEGGEANEFSFSLSPFIECLRRLEDITLYSCQFQRNLIIYHYWKALPLQIVHWYSSVTTY